MEIAKESLPYNDAEGWECDEDAHQCYDCLCGNRHLGSFFGLEEEWKEKEETVEQKPLSLIILEGERR